MVRDVAESGDRPADDEEIEVAPEMINAGLEAILSYDPDMEEPEALAFAIAHRVLCIHLELRQLKALPSG